MTSRLQLLSGWSDLEEAGGQPLTPSLKVSDLQTSYRQDGDDRATATFPLGAEGVALIVEGSCLRYERADGSIEQWIVQAAADALKGDNLAVTATTAMSVLSERCQVRRQTADTNTTTITYTGTPAEVLADLIADCPEWPSYIIAGTVEPTDPITVSVTGGSALMALRAFRDAVNLIIAEAGDVSRLVWRRISSTQVAIDWLTSAVAGSPTFIQGHNLLDLVVRTDRSTKRTRLLPQGAGGADIGTAYFWVTAIAGDVVTLGDWAYRTDRLVIGYDNQWVGQYLVTTRGVGVVITASSKANQTVTLGSVFLYSPILDEEGHPILDEAGNEILDEGALIGGGDAFAVNDLARFGRNSDGDHLFVVTNPNVTVHRDGTFTRSDLTPRINWLRNSGFEHWPNPLAAPSDWVNSLWTLSQNSVLDVVASRDVYDATPDPGVSDADLSSTGFSHPDSTSITGWEYNGGDSSRYIAWNAGGGILPKVGVTNGVVARWNADAVNQEFHAHVPLFRLSVDGASDQGALCVCVPNTAIGSWGNDDFIMLQVQRASSATADITLRRVALGGAVTTIGTVAGVAWALSSTLTLGIRVTGNALTSYYNIGAGEVAGPSTTLTSTEQDASHRRFGTLGQRSGGSTGFKVGALHVEYSETIANPTAGDVETGNYSVHLISPASITDVGLSQKDTGFPKEILSPGGGSQVWIIGCRYKLNSSNALNLFATVDDGATWTLLDVAVFVDGEYASCQGTVTTDNDSLGLGFMISPNGGADAANVDDTWMWRSGIDDGADVHLQGCDPARLVYAANRELIRREQGDVTYQAPIRDLTRDNPTTYPDDGLAIGQDVRIMAPGKSVDVTQTLVQLDLDELQPQESKIQLGAQRSRLTDQI